MVAATGFGKDFPILIYCWEKSENLGDNDFKLMMEKLKEEEENLGIKDNITNYKPKQQKRDLQNFEDDDDDDDEDFYNFRRQKNNNKDTTKLKEMKNFWQDNQNDNYNNQRSNYGNPRKYDNYNNENENMQNYGNNVVLKIIFFISLFFFKVIFFKFKKLFIMKK